MLRLARGRRVLSPPALALLALTTLPARDAWTDITLGIWPFAIPEFLFIAGAIAAAAWWMSARRPDPARAERRALMAALPRIADGNTWRAPDGTILMCRREDGGWSVLAADPCQHRESPGEAAPVTYTSYGVGRYRPVSRVVAGCMASLGDDGAVRFLDEEPARPRGRLARAAWYLRTLRAIRDGLLNADRAEIAGLAAMATEARPAGTGGLPFT